MDDYGTELVSCFYTGRVMTWLEAKRVSSFLPQAGASRWVDPLTYKPFWKLERAAFSEMDRNCNACAHLKKRLPPDRQLRNAGLIEGVCANPQRDLLPIATDLGGEKITFSPSDCMAMPCWESMFDEKGEVRK